MKLRRFQQYSYGVLTHYGAASTSDRCIAHAWRTARWQTGRPTKLTHSYFWMGQSREIRPHEISESLSQIYVRTNFPAASKAISEYGWQFLDRILKFSVSHL